MNPNSLPRIESGVGVGAGDLCAGACVLEATVVAGLGWRDMEKEGRCLAPPEQLTQCHGLQTPDTPQHRANLDSCPDTRKMHFKAC